MCRDTAGGRAGGGAGAPDLVHLGNLCVDITLPVPALPRPGRRREAAARALEEAGPAPAMEVGGSGNVLVMGSRLGLRSAGVGHFGAGDAAGVFMSRELAEEGVALRRLEAGASDSSDRTLECVVLVDPRRAHAFSSRYDRGPIPIFGEDFTFGPGTLEYIAAARSLSVNGMTFDELPPAAVFEVAAAARASGAEVMFDPGPRSPSFGGERRAQLDGILRSATVLSLTEDELESISPGVAPEIAAHRLLERFGVKNNGGALEWVAVKQGPEGAFVAGDFGSVFQESYPIDLVDSVGCGDSFDAALLLGRMRRSGARATLRLACAAGAATAEGHGAGRNVGTPTRMRELVAQKYGSEEMAAVFGVVAA